MSGTGSRQKRVLGGLALVLAALVWYQFRGWPPPAGRDLAVARPVPNASTPGMTEVVSVGLDRLAAARPAPSNAGRNPFRFGAAPPPAPGPRSSRPQGPAAGPPTAFVPTGPLPPPPPPPIPYKFIGLLTPTPGDKVAVLSDGRTVVHGRQGDVIDGRYRLVSVADGAVQMEYLDGRGRRLIRLTGA